MKVVIQDTDTRKYLARNGTWTPTVRDARDFQSSPYAHAIARRKDVRGLRVVLYFEDLNYSIAVRKSCDHLRFGLPVDRPKLG